MKKTPAIEETFRPLRWLEAKAKEQHDAKKSSHEAEQVAFESQRKALKREMDKRATKGQDMEEIKALRGRLWRHSALQAYWLPHASAQ